MKQCAQCLQYKLESAFYKGVKSKDGLRSKCKQCLGVQVKLWRQNNKARSKELTNRWRKNNPEKVKAITKRHYYKDVEKTRAKKRQWWNDNPEKVREIRKRFEPKRKVYFMKYTRTRNKMIKDKYGLGTGTVSRYGFRLALKIYDKFNRKCSMCGSEYDLTIHHLDHKGRNFENQGLKPNNSEDNLVVVCRRCHGSIHGKESWTKRKTNAKSERKNLLC